MQLSVHGRSLRCEVQGAGADTVIFVPALGASYEMWKPQVPAFLSAYTVVRYDGVGYQPLDTRAAHIDLADLAGDLAALADAVHARRPHIVGLSMGGMIGQVYAITFRDRLKSLVLAATTPSYPEDRRRQMEERATKVTHEGMATIVPSILDRWFTDDFRRSHPESVASIRHMLENADPQSYAAAARAVAAVHTTDQLPEIAAPTFILSGEHDASIPADAAPIMASRIPNVRTAVIPGAAHLANVSNPDDFNARVLRFIRQVDEATPGEPGIPGLPPHGSEAPQTGPPRNTSS